MCIVGYINHDDFSLFCITCAEKHKIVINGEIAKDSGYYPIGKDEIAADLCCDKCEVNLAPEPFITDEEIEALENGLEPALPF